MGCRYTEKKIIIIGAGIAGLSAGIYAIKAGYKAVIYEKNPVAGGECMGWNRKGYHIDNCIHWLTGTDPDTDLWKVWKTVGAIDGNTEYADTDKFYSSRAARQRGSSSGTVSSYGVTRLYRQLIQTSFSEG